MLNKLVFKVHFAPTTKYPEGQIIKGDHTFEKGLSAITGKNEAGKSLRLEMIRYALWGSQALRGASTSYNSIETELEFVINKRTYKIKRKGNKVTVQAKDENNQWIELATGSKPVKEFIRRTFGYDMEVFDVANACLQGEIEAMTNKKPSERKQMVDRTIGLDSIDKLISKVNADLTATRQAISLLNDKVIEKYEKPTPISCTKTSEELQQELQKIQEKAKEKTYIKGKLSALVCDVPVAPQFPKGEIEESLDELYAQLELIEATRNNANVLKPRLLSYEKIMMELDGKDIKTLNKYAEENYSQKWNEYKYYEQKRVDKPEYIQEDLDYIREGIDALKVLDNGIHTECPECAERFYVDSSGIVLKEPERDALAQEMDKFNIHNKSDLSAAQIRLVEYTAFSQMKKVDKPDLPEEKNVPYSALAKLRDFVGFDADEIRKHIEALENSYIESKTLLSSKIEQRILQEKLKRDYESKLERYNNYVEYLNEVKPKLDTTLKYIESEEKTVQELYLVVRDYEQKLQEYNIKQEAQSKAFETLAELENNLVEITKVKKSLNDLKPKVKSHLLPSLNKVASTLISQMTNNERTSIVVDEDFEILVDGQPVNTLSGSAKAVANLAVRIGLGTVLTNKVFSVFLADEIDAAMDSQRAAYTAQCLQNLTSVINQIILVSHQKPEADHQIEV